MPGRGNECSEIEKRPSTEVSPTALANCRAERMSSSLESVFAQVDAKKAYGQSVNHFYDLAGSTQMIRDYAFADHKAGFSKEDLTQIHDQRASEGKGTADFDFAIKNFDSLARHKDSSGKPVVSVDDMYKATRSAYEDVIKNDVAQGGREPKFSSDTKTIMSHTDALFPLSASPKEFAASVASVEKDLNKELNLPKGYAIELHPEPTKAQQRPRVTASLVGGEPHGHRVVLDTTTFDVRD